MATGYKGAQFSIGDHWVEAYGGAVASVFSGFTQVREDRRAEFDRKVDEIKGDTDLSTTGKQNRLQALATEYRNHRVVTKMQADIAALHAREAELRQKLTATPLDDRDKLSPYAAISVALSERATIAELKAMSPSERMSAMAEAIERRDHPLLALALRERGLLLPAVAQRVQTELMRQSDPDRYREFEHLNGKTDFAGNSDALTGFLPVTSQTLDLYLRHLDQAAGIDTAEREAQAVVDATDRDGAITLSVESAHDPYRAAYNRAAAKGIELRIQGDVGEGAISPGEFSPVTVDGNGQGK
jgi:hypothetical protein